MSTLTLPNGTVLTKVTRQSCLDRIAAIRLLSYEYSQTRIEVSTDKRADCTGWLSYVWDTPDSGPGIYLHAYNTASFYTTGAIRRIAWADLLPGDTIGYFSPTSPGNGGHGAIWMGGDQRPDGTFDVSDHGSGWGPKRRRVKWDGVSTGWLHPDHLAPWRYVALTEGGDMQLTDRIALPQIEGNTQAEAPVGAALAYELVRGAATLSIVKALAVEVAGLRTAVEALAAGAAGVEDLAALAELQAIRDDIAAVKASVEQVPEQTAAELAQRLTA